MIRHLIALGLFSITASGCRGSAPEAAALEPPAPLIEPELAPGSRLVDPRADELMRQMSERLARVAAFALEAEEVYDEVPEQSPRRQLTNLRRVAMRRPDRLVGDAAGDALNRSFWYDGKVFCSRRPRAERVDERRRTADGRPGPGLGLRADRHGHPARGFPLRRQLRATDGRRAAWCLPRHPRGGRRAVPPPVVRAGDRRLADLDRCRKGAAAPEAGDHLQDRKTRSRSTR